MQWMLMPLKRYADFSGRSRRTEFWMYTLFMFLVYAVFFVAMMSVVGVSLMSVGAAGRASPGGLFAMMGTMGIFFVIMGLFWLATLIPTLAVQVRRLHDTDRSGWWIMLWVAPTILATATSGAAFAAGAAGNGGNGLFALSALLGLARFVGAIVLLVFFFLPGTAGMNRFGPDPKDPRAQDLGEVFS